MSNYRTEKVERFAVAFQALANPNRLRIFADLMRCCGVRQSWQGEEGACPCVGDLSGGLSIAPSTVSHHIKELQRAGLIRTRRRGRHIECWIDPEILHRLGGFFIAPGPV
jgi:ArsR family transcriptional regulator